MIYQRTLYVYLYIIIAHWNCKCYFTVPVRRNLITYHGLANLRKMLYISGFVFI